MLKPKHITMIPKTISLLLLGSLLVHIQCSGVLPAVPAGIAYTRAIPYNVPPFAAAVSFLRTGPKPVIAPAAALLPPHFHARHAPVISPHFHAAASYYPPVTPHHIHVDPHLVHHVAPVAPIASVAIAGASAVPAVTSVRGVPAVLPHAASPVPHVGVVSPPHAHVLPHAHLAPALLTPVTVPHVHSYAAPAIVPSPNVHPYAAPGLHLHGIQALPHAHGHAPFAPLVARGHVHAAQHTHLDAAYHR